MAAHAKTYVRYILKGLDPATVETVFRCHAALLEAARARAEIVFSPVAIDDLRGLPGYLAQYDPAAASRIAVPIGRCL
jgi:hypothetical protein